MTDETTSRGLTPLSADERVLLLAIARAAIEAAIAHTAWPSLDAPSPLLSEHRGAFVSLHQGEHLRGCIGTLAAEQELWMTVRRIAVASAFDDPRFQPLSAAELQLTTIEISRLSLPRPARPDEVVLGRHGVCVSRGEYRGVFLPQVVTTHGWDRQTLLEQACLKASLPRHAWRDAATTLLIFEAEVFSEDELPQPGPAGTQMA